MYKYMQTLHFSQTINAPVKKVWDVMLADKTYREWTALFMAGSHFEGNWEQGSKMLFMAPDENGKKDGMGMKTTHLKNWGITRRNLS